MSSAFIRYHFDYRYFFVVAHGRVGKAFFGEGPHCGFGTAVVDDFGNLVAVEV
ncbi:hypothetical protein LJR129_002474 [Acidovorax sp. LjRoot129]|uniref:hypothetical protein n=1 Tax=Acidovorax sp. LjRoot129 TaxID=3342260 RepID=UPI003ED0417A